MLLGDVIGARWQLCALHYAGPASVPYSSVTLLDPTGHSRNLIHVDALRNRAMHIYA